jgi:hypothetical protein
MPLHRLLAGLLLSIACAPQAADRAGLAGLTDAPVRPPDVQSPAGAAGPRDASDALTGREGPSQTVDARVDLAPPPDAAARDRPLPPPDVGPMPEAALPPPPDTAPEAPAGQIALLVVGDPGDLSGGDTRLRTAILAQGLTLRVVDDGAAANVAGVRLVVLSGSCASATLGIKYRDVAVPVLSSEAAVYDTMGMTGAGTGLGAFVGGSLNILMPTHPMAAGLQGTVAVVGTSSNLGWGRPAPGAERVAAIPGADDQVAIFGYPKGTMMATVVAADRRVGFFATDNAAPNLGAAGVRLLGAAIDWALLP